MWKKFFIPLFLNKFDEKKIKILQILLKFL